VKDFEKWENFVFYGAESDVLCYTNMAAKHFSKILKLFNTISFLGGDL